jgi:NhaP-type Na+/H+ or K+/H+ antiporter
MDKAKSRKDWAMSTICWYAVFVWFGASLFSQTLYMAFNGTPYDANLLLKSAGPFAWIMIGIEIVVWGFIALFVGGKVVNRIQVSTQEIASSEQITPQA